MFFLFGCIAGHFFSPAYDNTFIWALKEPRYTWAGGIGCGSGGWDGGGGGCGCGGGNDCCCCGGGSDTGGMDVVVIVIAGVQSLD